MKDSFFKFPSTPHLATLPGVEIRDDKVLTPNERSALLARELTVEEKVDGANLGISFDSSGNVRAQNRGGYLRLPGSGQWADASELAQTSSGCAVRHADRSLHTFWRVVLCPALSLLQPPAGLVSWVRCLR